MAFPMYIVCSRGTSQDKETNLYSIFEIIDKLTITVLPPAKDSATPLIVERTPFFVSTSWMIDPKSGESFDDEFELHLRVYMDGDKDILDTTKMFKFIGPEWPAQRFTFNLMGPIPITRSGILLVECRVRKVGSPSWKQHSYRVVVERLKTEG